MKEYKKPIIGLMCVVLSCILVMGITLGLLNSANNTASAGSTTDTMDTTNTPQEPPAEELPAEEPPLLDEIEPEPEPELQWGYKFKYFDGAIDNSWIGDIAYKSQKNTFNIDDVTLTVSFGSLFTMHKPNEYDDVPEFDFYFADPSGYIDESIYTLKTIKEQFFSEKYNIKFVNDKPNRVYYHEYAHTEEITIPKELFTESEGVIRMVIAGTNVAEDWDSEYLTNYMILGEADIKYQMQGDKVILSKPYDDCWHY